MNTRHLLAVVMVGVLPVSIRVEAQGLTPKFMDPTEELEGNAPRKKGRTSPPASPVSPASADQAASSSAPSAGGGLLDRIGHSIRMVFPSDLTAVYTEIGSDVTSAIHYQDGLKESGRAVSRGVGSQMSFAGDKLDAVTRKEFELINGVESRLADYGLSVGGDWQGNYYGSVAGGYRMGSAFDEQIKLAFIYDFGKKLHLKGLKAYSNFRYRDGDDINLVTGAANGFNPSNIQSGKELRLMAQYLEYMTENGSFMINAGWMNPYDFFLQQPLSKLFQNNQIASAKGIGGNSGGGARETFAGDPAYNNNVAAKIPWSSTYDAWGGTLRIRPTKSTYATGGLYLAIPNAAGAVQGVYAPTQVAPYTAVPSSQLGKPNPNSRGTVNNNGLSSFGGAGWNAVGEGQPNGNTGNPNGLYVCSEFGWEPRLGRDKLEGKYAFGMIWWGIQDENFLPVTQSGSGSKAKAVNAGSFNMGSWAWYFQADQLLYRVKEPDQSPGKNPSPARNFSKKGLYMFNAWSFSPSRYSLLDFYYQTGLVYQGLIPGRPDDRLGVAFGSAWFSSDAASAYNQTYEIQTAAAIAGGKAVYPAQPQPTWGGVVEIDYQCMLTKWISVKPFLEYIMNPQQNGTLGNVLVLGTQAAVRF
ncbi:MAG: carbohydrate porin [Chthoniobacterales bacterium]